MRGREPAELTAAPKQLEAGALWLSLTGAWARGDERERALTHLCAAVRHAELEVRLDGQQISCHPREWFTCAAANTEGPGFRVRVGLDEQRDGVGVLELWTAGVCVERRPLGGFASCAVVELDTPRRDLGQIAIVDDATVEQALAAVELGRQVVLAALAQADASWTPTTRPPEWPPARVDRALGRTVRAERPRVAPDPLGRFRLVARIADGSRVGPWLLVSGWICLLISVTVIPAIVDTVIMAAADPLPMVLFLATGLAGVTMCAPSWQAARKAMVARDRGHRTHATIHAIARVNAGQVVVQWCFTDHEGREHHGRSFRRPIDLATCWSVGERILVYYNADQPERSWWRDDVGPPRPSPFTRP